MPASEIIHTSDQVNDHRMRLDLGIPRNMYEEFPILVDREEITEILIIFKHLKILFRSDLIDRAVVDEHSGRNDNGSPA